jgi:hypothetical protein
VEEDALAAPQHSRETLTRAYLGAVATLSLGVLGSTVLPVPFAISRVGLLMGALTMLVVAWANDVTSCLLVRAAAYAGHDTYEGLAHWAGGVCWLVSRRRAGRHTPRLSATAARPRPREQRCARLLYQGPDSPDMPAAPRPCPPPQRITQASLLVLLFGTMCGGISLLADLGMHIAELAVGQPGLSAAAAGGGSSAAAAGAAGGGSGEPPALLLSGPAICLAAVLLVLLPMCLLRRIGQLEGAATCGVAMVLALVALLGYDAAKAGFPAVRDGSLPIWTLQVRLGCCRGGGEGGGLRPSACCLEGAAGGLGSRALLHLALPTTRRVAVT